MSLAASGEGAPGSMRWVERLTLVARRAVADCEGGLLVERALAGRSFPARVFVTGAGKAVAGMAMGAWRALGDRMVPGPLVAKDADNAEPEVAPTLFVSAHPIPDQRSVVATHALLSFLKARGPDDQILFLLSGGASALLGAPLPAVPLDAWQAATRTLLASGLSIQKVNAVRRHLGLALGGRLALATRGRVHALVLSDVVGDDPAAIGSGPVSADPSTFAEALAVAKEARLDGEVMASLLRGVRGELAETPKPEDPRLARILYEIVATPRTLLVRGEARVAEEGLRPVTEQALVEGDVEALAARYAARAHALLPGEVMVAVGEPTVRVRGGGRGGRAQHLAGLMATSLADRDLAFVALASDGTDGPTPYAGAAIDGSTAGYARSLGMDLAAALERNDASTPLLRAGCLVTTGATRTNLLDLHLLGRAPR